MYIADKHNFGKSVEKTWRASGTWFQKPRTVFWEWLFLGKDSPLAKVFFVSGANGDKPLSSFLFNLEIEVSSEWLGYSKELREADSQAPGATHFYGFGVLLAYSYIFGIRDLHRQNVVMTETHLQPVDVEVVLTKLVLPAETILLPFKNVGYEFAAIGRLGTSADKFTAEQVQLFFAGYFDLFQWAIKQKLEIVDALGGLDLSQHPARVIMRNTSEYTRHLQGHHQLQLLPSEKAQIDRGDIPYYFKTINDNTLKWLSEPNKYGEEIELGVFAPDVKRHAISHVSLLEINLTESKMVQGAMQLLRQLGDGLQKQSFNLNGAIQINSLNSLIKIGSTTYDLK